MGRLERIAQFVATAVAVGWLAYTLASWFLSWNPADAGAYLGAAERLRVGAPLYPAASPEAHEVYRYAPWFAYLWIPLTYLPADAVKHAWSLAMLVCAAVAVAPLLERPNRTRVVLAALLAAPLAETAMFGNVHPLVVAILSISVRRASGPVLVGMATTLKVVPILIAVGWLWRGQWRKAAVAIVVAAALLLPMLLFDLSGYSTTAGSGLVSLYAVSPALWLAVALAVAAGAAILALRRSPHMWVALGALAFLGPPRVSTAYIAFMVPSYLIAQQEVARRLRGVADRNLPSAAADA